MITVDTRTKPAARTAAPPFSKEKAAKILEAWKKLYPRVIPTTSGERIPIHDADKEHHTSIVAIVCMTPGCKHQGRPIEFFAVIPGSEHWLLREAKEGSYRIGYCKSCLRQGTPNPRIIHKELIDEVTKTPTK